jgi:ATP-dependent Clp protease ATP-binding subunit ClpE
MLCSICKTNIAVVFVTKIVNGKQTQEGLCLPCAKKQGILPMNQLIDQTGLTEENIENFNKQFNEMFASEESDEEENQNTNPFAGIFGQLFNKNEEPIEKQQSSQSSVS